MNQADKFRHLAALIRFELQIEKATKDALSVWLPQVEAAVLRGKLPTPELHNTPPATPIVAAINPDVAENTRQSWQDQADKIIELIGNLWMARYLASGAKESNAAARRDAYMTKVRRRLYDIPSKIFKKISSVVSHGITTGQDMDEIAEQVRRELSPKNQTFKDRAVLIGRTEAVSVYNAGNQAGHETLNQPLSKKWLSLHDHRVRPTHVVADGQVVSLMAKFEVGGFAAEYPGDPALPIWEAAQCRCIAVYGTAQELGGS